MTSIYHLCISFQTILLFYNLPKKFISYLIHIGKNMINCQECKKQQARIKTAKDGQLRCPECFIAWFEQDIHQAIVQTKIFNPGDRIGVGVSGGKDSTVLAHVLSKLNQRHGYGLELILLCIDEGIKGYRDDSIQEVRKNEADLQLPLVLVSYKELYGWTMDEIVAKIGRKNNCTFCGVFRRQALDRAAIRAGATKLATGHNADDAAETVLMNLLRGDVGRLQRGALHHQQSHVAAASEADDESLPRVKPMKYSFEKDIVMYAHFGQLNYFSTECIYAPNAYRMNARSFIKDLERIRPRAILDIVHSGEQLRLRATVSRPTLSRCQKCGYITSQKFCKACLLLYGLNNNETGAVIARKSKQLQDLNLAGDNEDEGKEQRKSVTVNGDASSSEMLNNGTINSGCSPSNGCVCSKGGAFSKIVDF